MEANDRKATRAPMPNVNVNAGLVSHVRPLTGPDGQPRTDSKGRARYSAMLRVPEGVTVRGAKVAEGQGRTYVGVFLNETQVERGADGSLRAAGGPAGVNVAFVPGRTVTPFRYEDHERVDASLSFTTADELWDLCGALKAERESYAGQVAGERAGRVARSYDFGMAQVASLREDVDRATGQPRVSPNDGQPMWRAQLRLDGARAQAPGGMVDLDGWLMGVTLSSSQADKLRAGGTVTKVLGGAHGRDVARDVWRAVDAPDGTKAYEHLGDLGVSLDEGGLKALAASMSEAFSGQAVVEDVSPDAADPGLETREDREGHTL